MLEEEKDDFLGPTFALLDLKFENDFKFGVSGCLWNEN